MPAKKSEQVAWSDRFNTVVGGEPLYGVPTALMTQFALLNTTLQGAWDTASNPATRTKGNTAELDNALKAMKKAAKNIVSIIQGTPSVTDKMKIDAGLTVRKTHNTPVPVPSQQPFIRVKNITGRTVTLELCQDLHKRAKPTGVSGATVLTATGGVDLKAADSWKFATNTSITTVEIPFPPSATGDTVYVSAFWFNSKKESGPAAEPLAIQLPAGGMVMEQANPLPKMKAAA
jgi:hypothetical protein